MNYLAVFVILLSATSSIGAVSRVTVDQSTVAFKYAQSRAALPAGVADESDDAQQNVEQSACKANVPEVSFVFPGDPKPDEPVRGGVPARPPEEQRPDKGKTEPVVQTNPDTNWFARALTAGREVAEAAQVETRRQAEKLGAKPAKVETTQEVSTATGDSPLVSDDAKTPANPIPEADSEAAVSFLEVAQEKTKAFAQTATTDTVSTATYYQSITLPEVAKRLDAAVQTIAPVVDTLREAAREPESVTQIAPAPTRQGTAQPSGPVTVNGLPVGVGQKLDASDLARFANLYQNALDKAEAASDAIKIQINDNRLAETARNVAFLPGMSASGAPGSPGALLGMPPALTQINPLARTPELANIFPFPADPKTPPSRVASSNDGLVDRIVMFNGLPERERSRVLGNLKFVELPRFKRRGGRVETIPILHNGYIFGKSDCSSFVSDVLFGSTRATRLTTLDFQGIWFLLLNGRLPLPPEWAKDRAQAIKAISRGFAPVAIDRGEALKPGDLIVFRHPKVAWGHVFLVRSYDPVKFKARVIEASQSAGTIRERDFFTVFGVKGEQSLYYIPGLFGLRMKAGSGNPACSVKGGGA